MLWDIWVQPNKIIEEEFPDGWSHDDVMDAAQNRYAGKVTNVAPSTLFGAYTFGAVGAVLALPVAATIQGVLGIIISNRKENSV